MHHRNHRAARRCARKADGLTYSGLKIVLVAPRSTPPNTWCRKWGDGINKNWHREGGQRAAETAYEIEGWTGLPASERHLRLERLANDAQLGRLHNDSDGLWAGTATLSANARHTWTVESHPRRVRDKAKRCASPPRTRRNRRNCEGGSYSGSLLGAGGEAPRGGPRARRSPFEGEDIDRAMGIRSRRPVDLAITGGHPWKAVATLGRTDGR